MNGTGGKNYWTYEKDYKESLPILKKTSSRELPKVPKHENLVLKNTETNALAETNQLIYSIAAMITSVLGYNVEK